jgi:hypothetical protein
LIVNLNLGRPAFAAASPRSATGRSSCPAARPRPCPCSPVQPGRAATGAFGLPANPLAHTAFWQASSGLMLYRDEGPGDLPAGQACAQRPDRMPRPRSANDCRSSLRLVLLRSGRSRPILLRCRSLVLSGHVRRYRAMAQSGQPGSMAGPRSPVGPDGERLCRTSAALLPSPSAQPAPPPSRPPCQAWVAPTSPPDLRRSRAG